MPAKTILTVDANNASRHYLGSILREKQYTVLESGTGKEALIIAWRDQPDLILFDPVLPDIRDEEFIHKLHQDARTAAVPLIALSSDPSPARKQACVNAGVQEYLVKSAEAIPALEEILTRIFINVPPVAEIHEAKKEPGLLIVFLSAKGGTGTSSMCANLAMNIKQTQPDASVVVADLVLPIGSIGQIVGYSGSTNLVTVTGLPADETNGEFFHKELPEPELWKFQLLAGSPDPQHGNELKGERIGQIVDELQQAYDFIILDIGRSLSRISLPLIQKADLITLIMSTDQSTITLTKTVWDYLQAQGIDAQNIYPILNRAIGLEGLSKAQAEDIIGIPIKTTMPYMGSNFSLANNLNQPITTKYPTDTASIILKQTAEDMVKLARKLRA